MDEQVYPDGDTGAEDVAAQPEESLPDGVRPADAAAADQIDPDPVRATDDTVAQDD